MNNIYQEIRRFLKKPMNLCASKSPLLAYIDRRFLFSPENLLRLGSVYGGWIIPAQSGLSSDSVCYSAGAGEDISFDCKLASHFGCNVRIIDPTPRAIIHFKKFEDAVHSGNRFPINNSATEYYEVVKENFERLKFLPIGLADKNKQLKFYLPQNPLHVSCSTVNLQRTSEYFVAQCYRLQTIMQQQGDDRVDLLKMNIEGAEYSVIKDVVVSKQLPRLLLIEFDEVHSPLDDNAGERIRENINQLIKAGMKCIAVENSNATFILER